MPTPTSPAIPVVCAACARPGRWRPDTGVVDHAPGRTYRVLLAPSPPPVRRARVVVKGVAA